MGPLGAVYPPPKRFDLLSFEVRVLLPLKSGIKYKKPLISSSFCEGERFPFLQYIDFIMDNSSVRKI
jgi:hypothetical protein